ncbi:transposase [Streptomyces sp. A012304]|uniref:transposase n=1 Tax=Streptomyces sp. A012304 TaxID=375446 RepID=UPI0028031197|nr:hypothetical protein ALMP_68000 [Streptomyces sp. A012304]
MSLLPQVGGRDACADLSRFRTAFYRRVSARADAFFELTDALLCANGPTRTPVELSLSAEHQRGYGSLYGALNHGRLDIDALCDLLISLPLPRFDGRGLARGRPVQRRRSPRCHADPRGLALAGWVPGVRGRVCR